jgi:hypothetical protein
VSEKPARPLNSALGRLGVIYKVKVMSKRRESFSLYLLLLVGLPVVLPKVILAQSAGNKAVYQNGTTVTFSQVWIDASAFWLTNNGNKTVPDLCTIIREDILKPSYPTTYPQGAVIDARGLYLNPAAPPAIGPITCTRTPFDYFQSTSPPPTTILLPATGIPISQTWVLPNNMKIIGQGQDTVIKPTANGIDAIDMGSSNLCLTTPCSGIVVEHLWIEGSGASKITGIVNNYAQSSSYVNDVTLNNIGCAGLVIGAQSSAAANSGPYTNITFGASGVGSGCTSAGNQVSYPLCIDIEVQTRGVHGATCIGASSSPRAAAIYVNASNNTLEDLHVETFWDGVQIGDVASGKNVSNVLVSNVTGGNNGTGAVQNIVHVCGPMTPGPHEFACKSSGSVQDVSVFQGTYTSTTFPLAATSLQDDVTGTSIPAPMLTGAYALGEALGSGYSRFTSTMGAIVSNGTASTAPTWSVGNTVAAGPCTTPGALYSNTSGGSGISVYVCTTSGWKPIA